MSFPNKKIVKKHSEIYQDYYPAIRKVTFNKKEIRITFSDERWVEFGLKFFQENMRNLSQKFNHVPFFFKYFTMMSMLLMIARADNCEMDESLSLFPKLLLIRLANNLTDFYNLVLGLDTNSIFEFDRIKTFTVNNSTFLGYDDGNAFQASIPVISATDVSSVNSGEYQLIRSWCQTQGDNVGGLYQITIAKLLAKSGENPADAALAGLINLINYVLEKDDPVDKIFEIMLVVAGCFLGVIGIFVIGCCIYRKCHDVNLSSVVPLLRRNNHPVYATLNTKNQNLEKGPDKLEDNSTERGPINADTGEQKDASSVLVLN